MKNNFEISEGWFCKHIFLTLSLVKNNNITIIIKYKNMYIYPKVLFEMYVLKSVKR
jgi:hypothetical protein